MAQCDDMKDGYAERDRTATPPRRFPEVERRASAISTLELDPLMTVCPECGTRFRVTEAQLQAAHGLVRCGTCAGVFDGVAHLVLDSPRVFASTDDAERALDALMEELMSDMRSAGAPERESGGAKVVPIKPAGVAHGSEAPVVPYPVEPGAARSAPDLSGAARSRALALEPAGALTEGAAESVVFRQPRRRPGLWTLAALLLVALGLPTALIWVRYDTLVRDPSWRPLFATLCVPFGCTLPQQRAVEQIRTRNLTVQSRSDGTDGMLVRVVIVNEADFPQAFPTLELTFSTLRGAMVAGHRFQPQEYLRGDARDLSLMPVNRPVQLELGIPDPGTDAVNYRLRLR